MTGIFIIECICIRRAMINSSSDGFAHKCPTLSDYSFVSGSCQLILMKKTTVDYFYQLPVLMQSHTTNELPLMHSEQLQCLRRKSVRLMMELLLYFQDEWQLSYHHDLLFEWSNRRVLWQWARVRLDIPCCQDHAVPPWHEVSSKLSQTDHRDGSKDKLTFNNSKTIWYRCDGM